MASWSRFDEESSSPQMRLGRSSSAGFLSPAKRGARSQSPASLQQHNPKQCYQASFEAAYRDIAKQRNFRRLENLFHEADVDRSGGMTLDEFRLALRKPWIQQSFSLLGVQPHQAEIVFKTMNKSTSKNLKEGIGIQDFMTGLENLVGGDLDGPPRDLDVDMLKPSHKAREKLFLAKGNIKLAAKLNACGSAGTLSSGVSLGSTCCMTPNASVVFSEPSSPSLQSPSRPSSRASMRGSKSVPGEWPEGARSTLELSLSRPGTPGEISTSGFFADEENFKSTASAKALHSAAATRRRCTRVSSRRMPDAAWAGMAE